MPIDQNPNILSEVKGVDRVRLMLELRQKREELELKRREFGLAERSQKHKERVETIDRAIKLRDYNQAAESDVGSKLSAAHDTSLPPEQRQALADSAVKGINQGITERAVRYGAQTMDDVNNIATEFGANAGAAETLRKRGLEEEATQAGLVAGATADANAEADLRNADASGISDRIKRSAKLQLMRDQRAFVVSKLKAAKANGMPVDELKSELSFIDADIANEKRLKGTNISIDNGKGDPRSAKTEMELVREYTDYVINQDEISSLLGAIDRGAIKVGAKGTIAVFGETAKELFRDLSGMPSYFDDEGSQEKRDSFDKIYNEVVGGANIDAGDQLTLEMLELKLAWAYIRAGKGSARITLEELKRALRVVKLTGLGTPEVKVKRTLERIAEQNDTHIQDMQRILDRWEIPHSKTRPPPSPQMQDIVESSRKERATPAVEPASKTKSSEGGPKPGSGAWVKEQLK